MHKDKTANNIEIRPVTKSVRLTVLTSGEVKLFYVLQITESEEDKI